MAQNWTSSDLVLALRLGSPPGPRRGDRLQSALRDAVRRGTLDDGDSLPSTRDLATRLGVARGTVVHVYEQLTAEGYLAARGGGRTRVAAGATASEAAPAASARARPASRGLDLRPGISDLRRFPADDWAWAYARAARRVGAPDLDYDDGRGHPIAREAIAGHLRRVRACATDPERIVLAQGFAQGLALVLPVLAARGVRLLAVEDPGDRTVDHVAHAAGIELVPLPVDAEGLRVDLLAASGAQATLVTPAHQSPTGVVLSPSRRVLLAEWAARNSNWIIEDDYDSEFRYDRQPLGAVQGLAPDRVVLIGSASKTHAPGVRVAWMAAPREVADGLAAQRVAADRGGPVVDQLAFAALIESGRHDRHIRAMRAVYAARRGRVVESLARVLPGAQLTGLAAGFHGLLALPSGVTEADVIARAAERSVHVSGLASFARTRGDLPPSLVLGFGNIDDEGAQDAVHRLGEVIGELSSDRP